MSYAGRAQWGGFSVQPVSDAVREGVRKFIGSSKGKPFYLRMLWMTSEAFTVLETEVASRPYLGLTDDAKDRVVDLIENGVGDALGPAEGD